MTDAREVAARVLQRVVTDDAFAAPALDAELARAGLDVRDAALATQIVYGSLRCLPTLDDAYLPFVRKGAGSLDAFVQAALRVATFQVLHLSRVPVHAAVDAAVGSVRRARGKAPSGFVNAVLRKVAKQRPEQPSPPTALVTTRWVDKSLRAAVGDERARVFLEARPLPPPIDLRVGAAVDLERLTRAIEEARPSAEVVAGTHLARCLRLVGAGDPRRLPGYAEGDFAVQEQGSQLVAAALGAKPGERVADVCAGRGGKTLALAEALQPRGEVTAIDVNEGRLDQIDAERARLGLPAGSITTECIDLTVGTGGLEGFDRVLVDAPCTGLGTVHRRPELLLRLGKSDPGRMGLIQRAILERSVTLLRPGGRLVYSVCSPTREEGPLVVEALLAGRTDLRLCTEDSVEASLVDSDGVARLGPWLGGPGAATDAYQIVCFERLTDR